MASRRIFLDIEEALARETRRITFHDARTVDKTIMRETFDPFSGEVVVAPVEADFYDSSADATSVEYPNFFIRLMKTREDRFTGRVVPEYGKWLSMPLITSPRAFKVVLPGVDAIVNPAGNDILTTAFQIRKVQPGYLIRLLAGNNIGTYIVSSITVSNTGSHTITVSSTLISSLPALLFNTISRIVSFQGDIDLNTVKIGDVFTDSGSNTFNITAVSATTGQITIDGSTSPVLTAGGNITRPGNVLQNTDLSPVRYLVMDPSQPVQVATVCGDIQSGDSTGVSPPIPLDVYYLIRIDSKTRQNHIDVLNRVWEEFNPPRTALPVIERSALSADQLLTADVTSGGSNTIQITDNADYNIGDPVFIFDNLTPTKRVDGEGFQRPFESKVVDKISTDQLVLADIVPDTYVTDNNARVVSNAEFRLLMFHFVDHVTKDVEGSQYWVHEFTFWVQTWIDRLEQPSQDGVVTDIATPIGDLDTENIIIDDV